MFYREDASEVVYDVAVIGAGVMGSAAACHIAGKGTKIILVEQFDVGHTRGSSHGGSRITRHLYNTDYYTKMTIEAFPLWEQVEKESGITVYRKTGIARFGPKGSKKLSTLVTNMHKCGLPVSVLDAKEMKQRYPHLNLPDNFECVYEEDAGILGASKAVTALQNVFIKKGGKLLDCHPITDIIPGDIVVLKSSKGDIKAKKIIITVGPWAKKVLKPLGLDLPLRTVRKEQLYWKITPLPDNGGRGFDIVVIADDDDEHDGFYVIPEYEYPGLVKVNYRSHHGGVEIDPDARDADTNQKGIEETKKFISRYLTGVSTTISIVEPCIVTKTPDRDFIIDKHPQYNNIVIGVGFSGHGFKLAPVVGKILCEMTMDLPLSYDITPFALNRFVN